MLGRKYQDHAKEIERKMREAEDSWERLEERVDVRCDSSLFIMSVDIRCLC